MSEDWKNERAEAAMREGTEAIRKAAEEKLKKIDAYAFDNEEVMIDPDANVSETREGAYIHCWLWVDADKPKRTRKRTVKNG